MLWGVTSNSSSAIQQKKKKKVAVRQKKSEDSAGTVRKNTCNKSNKNNTATKSTATHTSAICNCFFQWHQLWRCQPNLLFLLHRTNIGQLLKKISNRWEKSNAKMKGTHSLHILFLTLALTGFTSKFSSRADSPITMPWYTFVPVTIISNHSNVSQVSLIWTSSYLAWQTKFLWALTTKELVLSHHQQQKNNKNAMRTLDAQKSVKTKTITCYVPFLNEGIEPLYSA